MNETVLAGVDWGSQSHQVCALSPERKILGERSFSHGGEGLAQLVAWLIELSGGEASRVMVGIEVPRGPVVETLLEHGILVYSINPKQLDRFRDRHTVAGAKDDRRDAFVLADSLRTDLPAFHLVKPGDPVVVSLRELTRLEEDLSAQNTRLSNRLREQLWRFYPQLLELSAGADEPWVWELLELAPTPSQARFLTRGKIEKLLDRFRIRRLTADQVRDCLRQPAVSAAPGVVEAASYHLSVLLAQLRLLATQRKDCARRIDSLLDELEKPTGQQKGEHRDVTILRSLPGVGRVITATMLAEASQPLAERNYHALRAQSGIAPVTRQSGKSRHVAMRFGCNHRLRNALYHWARVSSQCDPSTKAHYHRLRQAGHTHPRALRGISSRLLKILIAMLRDRALYDASRFAQPETPKAA